MILSLQLGLPIPMFLQRSFKTYLQNLNVIWVSHISNILKSTLAMQFPERKQHADYPVQKKSS